MNLHFRFPLFSLTDKRQEENVNMIYQSSTIILPYILTTYLTIIFSFFTFI